MMNKDDPAIEDAQRLARRDKFTAADQRARDDKAATLTAKLRLIAAWHTPGGPTPAQPCPRKHEVCAEAADELERLTRERDEWAAKWQAERKKYAELRWPGLNGEVRARDA